ncbi:MAG: Crp/Fnr family transcriptional regulator [Bryobacteraceae bacterium]|nr:Crp/Fnr family transcriptional regulator [Bryobacteraceae bacterium]
MGTPNERASHQTHSVGQITRTGALEMLRSHPFTQELTKPQLGILARLAEVVSFEQDQQIFGSGDRSEFLYLLVSGTVSLELRTSGYTVRIQQLEAGETFGWSAMVDEPFRAFQVRALEECVVARLPGRRLMRACEENPRMGLLVFRNLAGMVARRLRATEARFVEFLGAGSKARNPA